MTTSALASSPRAASVPRILNRPYFLLLALCAGLILHAVYLTAIPEDAHITFRFARNLAQGHGFVWNIGEPPIEGFTTFLWVLIAAAGFKAGVDVFLLMQAIGAVAAVGTMILSFECARRRMGASNWVALVPCALLAAAGPLAYWASSSMEMTTFGFFLLFGVFSYLSHLQRHSWRWLLASSLSLCLASLLRPEGPLVFVVLAGLAVTVFWSRTRRARGSHLLWVLVYVLPLAVFFAWRLNEFGDPLPNTFYQKTGGGFWQHARGAGYLIYFAFYYLSPIVPFAALVAWEAGVPDIRQALRPAFWVSLADRHEVAFSCGALIIAWFAAMVYVGGDYMAMYRFMVPILPFLYLLLIPAVQALLPATGRLPHKATLVALFVAVSALVTVFHSTPYETSFFRVATWQIGNYQGMIAEREHVARFTLIGRFFEQRAGGESGSLATRAIGAMGYYAEHLAIHDLNGLTDRHIARVPARATNRGWAGHEKWDLDYSFNRLPNYFMLDITLVPEDFPPASKHEPAAMADAIVRNYPAAERFANWIRSHPEFIDRHYRLVTVWMEDHFNEEQGYFAFLERKDQREASDSTD
jgi:hypothetical protein